MHGTSTPGYLDKIPLPLHLTRVEGRDEECPDNSVQCNVKAIGPLQVAGYRLDTRTGKGGSLFSTPHQRPHWHTTCHQLPERGTPNKTGGTDNENHGTSPCMLAPVLLLAASWVEHVIKH